MTRSCGGCTACCFTPSIVELGKPRNTLCPHALPGAGCMIYNLPERPAVCDGFSCFWIFEGTDLETIGRKPILRDDERPDKVGVYFTPNGPARIEGQRVVWLAAYEAAKGSGEKSEAKALLRRLAKKRLVLVVWRAEWIGPADLVALVTRHTQSVIDDELRKRKEGTS